jgi:hypothetical protein
MSWRSSLAVAAECEHAAGEVGAVRTGQDEVSGVVGDEREAAALGDVPAEPLLAILEVVGGSTPAQQGDPPAIHLGDLAQLLANQGVALEVVMLFHQLTETFTQQGVGGCKLVQLDLVEDVLLGQGGDAETGTGHAPVCQTGRKLTGNLSLTTGCERFDRFEKSAVWLRRDAATTLPTSGSR